MKIQFSKDHKLSNGSMPMLLANCYEDFCSDVEVDKPVRIVAGSGTKGHPICKCGKIGPHLYSPADRELWFAVHKTRPDDDLTIRDIRGKRFGETGKSLSMGEASSKFGAENTKAGLVGEQALDRMFRNSPEIAVYSFWRSLRIPNKPGQKAYHGPDVDFIVANGNRLILVDCKKWSAGEFYWTLGGKVMKGFKPMSEKQISRNMEMAVDRYKSALPGHTVMGIVVFVPTQRGLPTSVGFLRWPGGIKSYLPSGGVRKITSFLGDRQEVTPQAQGLMGMMVR